MARLSIDASCNTCGNSQNHVIEVENPEDDTEVYSALDNQLHSCDQCEDSDWVVYEESLKMVDE